MNIRTAVLSDAHAIAEVHVRTWQAAYRGIVPDAYLNALSVDRREALWRESILQGTSEIWVADRESVVTGWVAFCPSRDRDATPTVGEVAAIYVTPGHWSTGTGRDLLNVALRRLSERHFRSVTLWVLEENERAIRFYRAAGFKPEAASRKDIDIGGKLLSEIRYERSLD